MTNFTPEIRNMIRIHPISGNKKQYLDLLLLADEQESMIDRYLERGRDVHPIR